MVLLIQSGTLRGNIVSDAVYITFRRREAHGLPMALRSTRVDAMSAMKEGQSQAAGVRSHSSAARWIVAAQIALSLILLIGTGLFIHTFANLMTLDAGFDR